MDIIDNLKAFIFDRGYSQEVVAEISNISISEMKSILEKHRKLEANELLDICRAICITPSELKDYKHFRRERD